MDDIGERRCEWKKVPWKGSIGFSYRTSCGLTYPKESKEDFKYCPQCGGVIATRLTLEIPSTSMESINRSFEVISARLDNLEREIYNKP